MFSGFKSYILLQRYSNVYYKVDFWVASKLLRFRREKHTLIGYMLPTCYKQKSPETFWISGLCAVLLSDFAVWTGLEPATPCVTGRYSNQLNYHTIYFVALPLNCDAKIWTFFDSATVWGRNLLQTDNFPIFVIT